MNTISEIETRAEQAEARAIASEIRLAIMRARLAELETEAARRSDAEAERAVRQLVFAGAIRRDLFAHHQMKATLLKDPSVIPLAIGKVFNQRSTKQK